MPQHPVVIEDLNLRRGQSARGRGQSSPLTRRSAAALTGGVLVLAVVFGTAALGKVARFSEFEASLIASRLVPLNQVSVICAGVVALEFILAAGLFLSLVAPVPRQPLLCASAVLFSTFLSYALWRQVQGIQVPCHCFGFLFTLAAWQAMLMNTALLSLITALLIGENRVSA